LIVRHSGLSALSCVVAIPCKRAFHNLARFLNSRFHIGPVRRARDLSPGVLLYRPELFEKHLYL
jgi:hypothetical protein